MCFALFHGTLPYDDGLNDGDVEGYLLNSSSSLKCCAVLPLDRWLGAVANGVMAVYLEKILGLESLSSWACVQLSADIGRDVHFAVSH